MLRMALVLCSNERAFTSMTERDDAGLGSGEYGGGFGSGDEGGNSSEE